MNVGVYGNGRESGSYNILRTNLLQLTVYSGKIAFQRGDVSAKSVIIQNLLVLKGAGVVHTIYDPCTNAHIR